MAKWGRLGKDYTFLIDLYSEAIESAYFSSRTDLIEKYGEILAKQSKEVFDEIRAIKTKALYAISKNELNEAIGIFLNAERSFGYFLPPLRKPSTFQVFKELIKTIHTQMMTGKSIEELSQFPIINDKAFEVYCDLATEIGTALYLNGEKELFGLMILRAIQFMLRKRGWVKGFATICVMFGLILIDIGAIESGYLYGKLALSIADRCDNIKQQAATKFTACIFIFPWKERLREVIPQLWKNYFLAVEAGNFYYASSNLWTCFGYSILSGAPLRELLEKTEEYQKTMAQLKFKNGVDGLEVISQILSKLTKSNIKEAEIESADPTGRGVMYTFRMMLHWTVRDFKEALKTMEALPKYANALTGMQHIPDFHFYKTLTLSAIIDTAPLKKRLGMRLSIARNVIRFKKYAKHGPANFLHKYLILKAEWFRISGRSKKAGLLYEQAIECAAEEKFLHEEAIANELAGRFYLNQKRPRLAVLFIREAINGYTRWGAESKIELLREEFKELLTREATQVEEKEETKTLSQEKLTTETHTLKIGSVALDTSTVQKSAETIASTIFMDELLKKLMRIAIEHAGAEKGLILMADKVNVL